MRTYEYRLRPNKQQEQALMKVLIQFLETKAESAGRRVVAVAPHYTSQKCSQCGGYGHTDRDENAARNILQRGEAVLARTEPSLREREGPEQYAGGSKRSIEVQDTLPQSQEPMPFNGMGLWGGLPQRKS